MVYGSETWALEKAHMELLSVAQRKMERIMLGITLRDHKRNTWIRHQTGVNDRNQESGIRNILLSPMASNIKYTVYSIHDTNEQN